MRFLNNFFNVIDITRKVFLNLLFILALLLLSITFFVGDVIEDHGPVITFAPKKINETTNSTMSFFEGENYPLSLFEIISAIEIATSREDIKILFMDLTYLDISFTGILEIGTALNEFKQSGKKVVAYSDFFDKKNYLLASYADSIFLNQNGMVLLDGFSSQKPFIRQFLEKLNIGVTTFISGQYKSALDTFTRDTFSEEDKLQTSFYLSEVWKSWKDEVVKNRKNIKSEEIDTYINNLGKFTMDFEGDTAKLALDKGFVDSLTTRTKLSSKLSSLTKIKNIVLKDNLSVFQNENHSENKLAVLVASGQIVDGEYAEGAIASENFSRVIEKINNDKSIKGLFLRINSPGGSGLLLKLLDKS